MFLRSVTGSVLVAGAVSLGQDRTGQDSPGATHCRVLLSVKKREHNEVSVPPETLS